MKSNYDISNFKKVYSGFPDKIKEKLTYEEYVRSSVSYRVLQVSSCCTNRIHINYNSYETTSYMGSEYFRSHSLHDVIMNYYFDNLDFTWKSIRDRERNVHLVWLDVAHNLVYVDIGGSMCITHNQKLELKVKYNIQKPWPDVLKIVLDVKPELDLWIVDCLIKYT